MGNCNESAYEKVTRQMVLDMKEDMHTVKEDVRKLTSNYAQRLPQWATIFVGVLMALVGGLAGGQLF